MVYLRTLCPEKAKRWRVSLRPVRSIARKRVEWLPALLAKFTESVFPPRWRLQTLGRSDHKIYTYFKCKCFCPLWSSLSASASADSCRRAFWSQIEFTPPISINRSIFNCRFFALACSGFHRTCRFLFYEHLWSELRNLLCDGSYHAFEPQNWTGRNLRPPLNFIRENNNRVHTQHLSYALVHEGLCITLLWINFGKKL